MIRDRFGAGTKARYIFRVCVFTRLWVCEGVGTHVYIYKKRKKVVVEAFFHLHSIYLLMQGLLANLDYPN